MAGRETATFTESRLTFYSSRILEAKYEATIYTFVTINLHGALATWTSVAATGICFAFLSWFLIVCRCSALTTVQDVDLPSEYLFIHRIAHGLVSISRVVLQYILCVYDNTLSCCTDGTTNDGLQRLLGSRVVGLHLLQCLLVLLDAGYCDSVLCHI